MILSPASFVIYGQISAHLFKYYTKNLHAESKHRHLIWKSTNNVNSVTVDSFASSVRGPIQLNSTKMLLKFKNTLEQFSPEFYESCAMLLLNQHYYANTNLILWKSLVKEKIAYVNTKWWICFIVFQSMLGSSNVEFLYEEIKNKTEKKWIKF